MAKKTPFDSINKPLSFLIKVKNKPLDENYSVFKLYVKKEVNRLSRASFSILGGDPYLQKFEESEDAAFKPGEEVEILMGYDQKNKTVFKGIIEKHSISMTEGYDRYASKSLLVIDCVDKAVKLTNTYTTEIYEKKKDSEIITNLLSSAGVTKKVKATSVKHEFYPKYNINDWDFIVQRSLKNGLVVMNSDNTIEIDTPKSKGAEVLNIENGKSTISFKAQIDSSSQYGQASFSSWDPFTEKKSQNKAKDPSLDKYGDLTGKVLAKKTSPNQIDLHYPQPLMSSEVKELGNSELLISRMSKLSGVVKVKGVNNVKLGDAVKLTGFGKHFDGKVFVTKVEQHISSGIYETSIGFGLKNIFPKRDDRIDVEAIVPQIQGVHIGMVKKIDKDPDNEYKIQVQIPSLKLTGDGVWARLTHFYTSDKAGSFFVPEKDSQVVVSFLANDPRYPVVLGGLYTKKNKPYKEINSTNELKAIVSKEKLTVEFDDKNKMLTIQSGEKNKLVISETDGKNWRGWKVKKGFTIEDVNGNIITTSDQGISLESKKDIVIDSKGKVSISGAKGIDLKANGGSGLTGKGNNIKLEASSKFAAKGGSGADLSAGGSVNVKGASVNIN